MKKYRNAKQKEKVERARTFDEIIVLNTLKSLGYNVYQGTENDDKILKVDLWLIGNNTKHLYPINVKRNLPKYKNSENFTFPIHDNYPYYEDGAFIYIDDVTNTILNLKQQIFKELIVDKHKPIEALDENGNSFKYIKFKKELLRNISETHEYKIQY